MSEISDFVSNDADMMKLISDGKFESNFIVMGNTIKFRILDYEQYGMALKDCSPYDLAFKSYVLQKEVLRRAFISINDKEFPNIEEAGLFLNKLPAVVVEFMFNKYEEAKGARDYKIVLALGKIKNGSGSQPQSDTGSIAANSSQTGSDPSDL